MEYDGAFTFKTELFGVKFNVKMARRGSILILCILLGTLSSVYGSISLLNAQCRVRCLTEFDVSIWMLWWCMYVDSVKLCRVCVCSVQIVHTVNDESLYTFYYSRLPLALQCNSMHAAGRVTGVGC